MESPLLEPVHFSQLKSMDLSPAHYRAAVIRKRKDTPAMALGRAVHAWVLEGKEPVAMPRFHKGLKDETAWDRGLDGGKESYAAWIKTNDPIDFLDPDDYETAERVIESLETCPLVGEIHSNHRTEVKWEGPINGVICAGRADSAAMIDDGHTPSTGDLKTLGRAPITPRVLEIESRRWMWPEQLAMYTMGIHMAGRTSVAGMDSFNLVVETGNAYAWAVVRYTRSRMRDATEKVFSWLDQVKTCREQGSWPGPGSVTIGTRDEGIDPVYDMSKFDELESRDD